MMACCSSPQPKRRSVELPAKGTAKDEQEEAAQLAEAAQHAAKDAGVIVQVNKGDEMVYEHTGAAQRYREGEASMKAKDFVLAKQHFDDSAAIAKGAVLRVEGSGASARWSGLYWISAREPSRGAARPPWHPLGDPPLSRRTRLDGSTRAAGGALADPAGERQRQAMSEGHSVLHAHEGGRKPIVIPGARGCERRRQSDARIAGRSAEVGHRHRAEEWLEHRTDVRACSRSRYSHLGGGWSLGGGGQRCLRCCLLFATATAASLPELQVDTQHRRYRMRPIESVLAATGLLKHADVLRALGCTMLDDLSRLDKKDAKLKDAKVSAGDLRELQKAAKVPERVSCQVYWSTDGYWRMVCDTDAAPGAPWYRNDRASAIPPRDGWYRVPREVPRERPPLLHWLCPHVNDGDSAPEPPQPEQEQQQQEEQQQKEEEEEGEGEEGEAGPSPPARPPSLSAPSSPPPPDEEDLLLLLSTGEGEEEAQEEEVAAAAELEAEAEVEAEAEPELEEADPPDDSELYYPRRAGQLALQGAMRQLRSAITARRKLHGMPISDVRACFAAIDTDGDGTLDRREFREALMRLDLTQFGWGITEEALEALCAAIDTNGDGEIDWHEFLHAIGMEDCGPSKAEAAVRAEQERRRLDCGGGIELYDGSLRDGLAGAGGAAPAASLRTDVPDLQDPNMTLANVMHALQAPTTKAVRTHGSRAVQKMLDDVSVAAEMNCFMDPSSPPLVVLIAGDPANVTTTAGYVVQAWNRAASRAGVTGLNKNWYISNHNFAVSMVDVHTEVAQGTLPDGCRD
jgi:hypothetical protein